jgi:hypothetical protein
MSMGRAYYLAAAATFGVIVALGVALIFGSLVLSLFQDDVPASKVNAQCIKHGGVQSVPKTLDDLVAFPGLSITVICRDGHYTRFDR